jgi:NAD(P)-dependent dehydrogenase (short-subunit alcohol dehydrogenase family)
MSTHSSGKSALVVGVGHAEGVGAAVARRFAREAFDVTIVGRNEPKLATALEGLKAINPSARAETADVTDEPTVRRLIAACDRADAPLEVAVFNAGGNWPKAYLDMDVEFVTDMWRVNALAGFIFSKAVVEQMLPRGRGTLIVTGASGSMRGKAMFGGFAQGKAALRALPQSCAREFGPQGLHVAHVVIDGAVDGNLINTLLPPLKEKLGDVGLLSPVGIAENYWHLHTQPRSAWTHELDLRPWVETW